ncbi:MULTISPECIES: histone deacetylase family protein [unclassified Lysobacter]|uniref:histone deacetylase family protein n=1 Tax=unclassified Lysobacter TaxID=2635362 RepID=UPI0007021DFF|nr:MULTISPECIES: histone deacetylase family protein [unclassified Lysobacter]KRA14926.1 acetoin utilization protein [Lysobacter sp. Root604]KRD30179.1 acetoin utilization protein [Lysobacter sp. Root916]KRD75499.1 acetoin utilization protein [Lysobacter sp. Root983]
MRVYTHPACTRHDPGPGHAERPLRLVAVTEALRESFDGLDWREAPSASRGQLLRAHDDALLALVLDTPLDGPMQLDPDTVLAPGSAEAALRAAGAGVAAVDAVLKGEETRVFCAVRPPGHHATGSAAMGFCLFNNIAVAAAHACDKHGLARVAVIDFDVHHGNGTQAIFDTDPRVLYVSSHQMPLYPDTGYADERGIGNIINAPLPPGAGSETFRKVWRERLLPAIDAFRPQLVLISAGFDAHRRDPLAQLELDGDDYRWITAELVAIADKHALGRVVSMLEGGYDLAALRECAVAHVGALLAPAR